MECITKERTTEATHRYIPEADAIVAGIGADVVSRWITYIGSRFEDAFPDFIEKYQFLDMLQASLFHFPSWKVLGISKSFCALRYLDQPVGQSYVELLEMLKQSHTTLSLRMRIMRFGWLDMTKRRFIIFKANMGFSNVVSTVIQKRIAMIP